MNAMKNRLPLLPLLSFTTVSQAVERPNIAIIVADEPGYCSG